MTAERVYTSAQVAKVLDLSGGMLRRYALTLEELTGEPIPQDPRDGRRFSQHHVDVLTAARRFVASHKGTSVEAGLKRALGMADEVSTAPLLRSLPSDSPDVVLAFAEVVGPLVDELQALRESNARLADEVAELRSEIAGLRALPPAETEAMSTRPDERHDGGPFVRLARRLEHLLGRG